MSKITVANIERKKEDTLRIIFELRDQRGIVPISFWTQFELIVDSLDRPVDNSTRKELMLGVFETSGADGKVHFIPSGTIDYGDYFYEARGRNANGELLTFAAGTYSIT